MNVRVTQFGSETEPDSNDLPDHLDSDSSFERRMRSHVTRQQAQTRRNVHSHRMNDVAMNDFDRRPKNDLSSRGALHNGGDVEGVKTSPSSRQRRRLNRPLEDFDRSGSNKIKNCSVMNGQGLDRAKLSVEDESAVPDLFSRFNRVRNGTTPRSRPKENRFWDEPAAEYALPSIEDSPLSRKSIGRGTPAASELDHSQALDKVLSWNIIDDFNEQSMLVSTPAVTRKRPTLAEIRQAEIDASAARETLLEHASGSSEGDLLPNIYAGGPRISRDKLKLSPQRPRVNGSAAINHPPAPASEDELFLTLPEVSVIDNDHLARANGSQHERADLHLGSPTKSGSPHTKQPLGKVGQISQSPSSNAVRPGGNRSNGLNGMTKIRDRAEDAHVDDSINVLRRLSRSVSGTPTPQKPADLPKQRPTEHLTAGQRPSRLSNPQIRDEGDEPFAVNADALNLQHGISDQQPQRTILDTPRVTGGWIQTPMTKLKVVKQSGVPVKTDLKSEQTRVAATQSVRTPDDLSASEPKHTLPSSALSAVVHKAKGQVKPDKGYDGFGDSTINSLEDLIEQLSNDEDLWDVSQLDIPTGPGMMSVEDRTAIVELLEESIAQELPYSNGLAPSPEEKRLIREIVEQRVARGLGPRKTADAQQQESSEETQNSMRDDGGPRSPMTPRRKGRLLEELQLQRMSEHVHSMHSRTRSLSKGLGRIERKLADTGECTHATCNGDCFASHPVSAYGNVVRRLLVTTTADGERPSKLGWILSTLALWLCTEIAIWYINSQPLFSEHNHAPFASYNTSPSPPFYLIYAISSFLSSPIEYITLLAKEFWLKISGLVLGLARQRASSAPAHTAVIDHAAAGQAAQYTQAVLENAADYSMDNDVIL